MIVYMYYGLLPEIKLSYLILSYLIMLLQSDNAYLDVGFPLHYTVPPPPAQNHGILSIL